MTYRHFSVWLETIFALVFSVGVSTSALATTYTYTSPNYTAASITSNGTPVFTTAMNVTASFTTASPLPPNLSLVDIGPSGSNLIQTWTIFDGLHTYTPSTASLYGNAIKASTDASGNITVFQLITYFPPFPYVPPQKFSQATIAFPSFVEASSDATCTQVDGAGVCINAPSNTIGSDAGAVGAGTFTASAPVAPTFTAAPNPALPGQTVVLTANSGNSAATGTVTFSEGTNVLCNAVALLNGIATCSTSTLSVGAHTLTATFTITTTNITAIPPFGLTTTVTITALVTGVCGSDNGLTLSVTPTHLCSAGTPSAVTSNGVSWNWTCAGSNIDHTATCSAKIATTPPPPAVSAPMLDGMALALLTSLFALIGGIGWQQRRLR